MHQQKITSKYEDQYWNIGKLVCGIDEVGRGPLAGPVVAAAVILHPEFNGLEELTDSKRLSERSRLKIYPKIIGNSISIGVGFVDNLAIDSVNILSATMMAMNAALDCLTQKPEHLFIDGNYFRTESQISFETIVKGDSKCLSIAAASVIAKVIRDRWMTNKAALIHPDYSFDKHKGYATKKHFEAIDNHGICSIHRKTFLKKYFSKQQKLF